MKIKYRKTSSYITNIIVDLEYRSSPELLLLIGPDLIFFQRTIVLVKKKRKQKDRKERKEERKPKWWSWGLHDILSVLKRYILSSSNPIERFQRTWEKTKKVRECTCVVKLFRRVLKIFYHSFEIVCIVSGRAWYILEVFFTLLFNSHYT